MENQSRSDSSITPAPTLPRRAPVDAELGRFSSTTAPQRDVVDSFCRASRPWALRQAKRTYRHLPESLREQAVDRAYAELRTRTLVSTERRALSAELAERLTDSLRHVHVGWCLNESSALLRREGTEPVQPEVRREDLAAFVDEGLGGLERAILQLEIGAGRDTRSTRAALRLHPRRYAHQRDAGLSKLRDAISASVVGRACDQHVSGVVDAAMGDRAAMDTLATGSQRCRACAREAQGLRSVLHERLAVAPWPLAIKPAGLVAAKVAALGAVVGGKSAGAGGAGVLAASAGGGSGASMAASVLAVAALATGAATFVGGDDATPRERVAGHSSSAAAAKPAAASAAKAAAVTKPKAIHKASAPKQTQARGTRRHKGGSSGGGAGSGLASPVTTTPATSSGGGTTVASTQPSSAASKPSGAVGTVTKPVTDAVDDTAKQVTDTLPAPVASPVQGLVDDATDTVDDLTGAVDGVLKP